MGKFLSTKTYNTDQGLSCCFRQWRATHSHCSKVHGYSIGLKLIFECDNLDERNWVQDFGGLTEFKNWLRDTFDHKWLVAEDDPMLEQIKMNSAFADIIVVPAVGCEKFAEMAYHQIAFILAKAIAENTSLNPSVRVKSVEVFEHGANSAIYVGDENDDLKAKMKGTKYAPKTV
jgi:6-pyruvoyltetrahydropterin/6-carboxytetrahydropterin synthase